jgi:serine/threonine-protein kinase
MPTSAPVQQIGDYVLERELGRGAHGVVYRAHHRGRPEVPVALKVVEGRGNVDRLLLEPAVLSRLEHPCIVGIEDYFLRGDNLVLALEFVAGEDLKSLLDRGETLAQDNLRELLVQLAGALAEAHNKNVIHRDIKPSNILVVREAGRLRFVLTDFGIGQVAESIQVKKHTGGTLFFMAPEQLRGRPCPQSDLWALGVVAYRLLTRRLPFPGPSLGELSQQILYAAPAPPSLGRTEPIDPQLEAVVMRLLDKSLQERFASAEELLRALGHSAGGAQVLQRRHRPKAVRNSLDDRLRKGIARRRLGLALVVLLYVLPGGLVSTFLALAGMAVFYAAQRAEGWRLMAIVPSTLLAFALLGGSLIMRVLLPQYDYGGTALLLMGLMMLLLMLVTVLDSPFVLPVFSLLLLVYFIGLPILGGALFASLRRLRREQVLRAAAAEAGTGSDRYLRALGASIDTRFEDVGLHLKYAEALFARGQVAQAAVEARLLLVQDPYHFGGNLLLANAYHALGLLQDCVAVCDSYLKVSGYCFEFSELAEQCQRRLRRP